MKKCLSLINTFVSEYFYKIYHIEMSKCSLDDADKYVDLLNQKCQNDNFL